MPRPKKNKHLQVKEKVEVSMTKASDETVEKIKEHKETMEQTEEVVLDSVQTEIDISLSERIQTDSSFMVLSFIHSLHFN